MYLWAFCVTWEWRVCHRALQSFAAMEGISFFMITQQSDVCLVVCYIYTVVLWMDSANIWQFDMMNAEEHHKLFLCYTWHVFACYKLVPESIDAFWAAAPLHKNEHRISADAHNASSQNIYQTRGVAYSTTSTPCCYNIAHELLKQGKTVAVQTQRKKKCRDTLDGNIKQFVPICANHLELMPWIPLRSSESLWIEHATHSTQHCGHRAASRSDIQIVLCSQRLNSGAAQRGNKQYCTYRNSRKMWATSGLLSHRGLFAQRACHPLGQ